MDTLEDEDFNYCYAVSLYWVNCFSSFAVLGWRTSSSTASEMMLMWFQTQRFVELLQSYFFVSFRGMHLMLTEFFFFYLQNIKKLLKIPYSKSHLSMAVHRVGRTLLLDELDIQELFMRSSQVQPSDTF